MKLQSLCPRITGILKEDNLIILDAGCASGIDELLEEMSGQEFSYAYGFEASEKEFQKVDAKNSKENIKYYNLALFDRDGEIDFYDSATVGSVFERGDREEAYGEVFEKKSIKCAKITTLVSDGLISKIPDFIKLDVEGSEIAVLRGLGESLKTDVLGVKVEFAFHSKPDTNNFGEIHLMLIEAGFMLMDIAYGSGPVQGLSGGDALYIKRPDFITSSDAVNNKKAKLLKLAVISHCLRIDEICALIVEYSADFLLDEEKEEIGNILYQRSFIPNLVPYAFPRLSIAFFMLSQICAGRVNRKKSIPKLNRLTRINFLFSSFAFLKTRQKKFIDQIVKRYLTIAENRS